MIKRVLIVDDDQEMLLSLREGLQKYDESFSVLLAGDGKIAMDKLKEGGVSLVVTDLKMPRVNGFTLLSHIMENYPDIPVVIITGYSTPDMEKLAHSGGAVGYIEKPFMVEDLARQILATLRKESDGGTLHGVSSGMFLQLIEMEQKTCTIRLVDKSTDKQGVLFFKEGDLIDARVNGTQGVEAAYEIFSWEEVTLSIQNVCPKKDKKITSDLQAILLEAMRLKDESAQKGADRVDKTDEKRAKAMSRKREAEMASPLISLRKKLRDEMGSIYGLEQAYLNRSWDGLLKQVEAVGSLFNSGKFKAGYVDRGESKDFILLSGEIPAVFSIDPRCPKDRVMEILIQ